MNLKIIRDTIFNVKKIDFAANIAILVVAVVFIGILIHKFYIEPSRTPSYEVEIGTMMQISDIGWRENQKTVILALKQGCQYCSDSAEFYKQLVETASQKKVRVIAVLPGQVDESRNYLKGLGLSIDFVVQTSLDTINVRGTPTLILTDDQGQVIQSWVGRLKPEKEAQVLNSL